MIQGIKKDKYLRILDNGGIRYLGFNFVNRKTRINLELHEDYIKIISIGNVSPSSFKIYDYKNKVNRLINGLLLKYRLRYNYEVDDMFKLDEEDSTDDVLIFDKI